MESAAKILQRLDALKSLRRPHEQVWRDCYDHTFPLRGSGFTASIDAQEGQRRRAALLDSTATDSVRILASSIMSGLTPANSRWFSLDVGDESDDERRWLDMVAQTLWENIHMSNFDAAAFEAMLDVVIAGWCALYIDEDPDRGGLRFTQWPISSVYCTASKPGGRIDIVYRLFSMTAEQAVAEFGDTEVSQNISRLAKEKPDQKLDFVHAIFPRKRDDVGARLSKNLPIASLYVETKEKKIVRESGYHEMPVVIPRWMVIPDTPFGVGPVFDALPDIKMLNELKSMELAAADLAIAGMWIAEDDGVLNPRAIKVGPRKIIVANSVDSMKPLKTGSDFQLSTVLTDQLQRSIRKTLMADQLQPQDGPAMTATEVHVRVHLIRQLLGPIYGRLQAEYLQPLIERCFGLGYRAGAFGQAPESLMGIDFTVRYISPLARAQQLEDVSAVERLQVNIANMAQIKPGVLDLIDEDAAVRVISDALGVPSKIVRKASEVEEMRLQRAQQQQLAMEQQQVAQMMQTAGESIVKRTIEGAS